MLTTTLAARRTAALVAFVGLTLGLLSGPLAWTARAAGTASSVVAAGNLAKDGTLKVTEKITFSGAAPAQLTQRFETTEDLVGGRRYQRELSAISGTAGGRTAEPAVVRDGRYTTLTLQTGGAGEVTLSYTVTGAVVTLPGGGTALRWAMLQGLTVSVDAFRATVAIPGLFDYVKCTAGGPNSTVPCATAAAGTEDAQTPTFTDGPRGEGEVVSVDIGFPPRHRSHERADRLSLERRARLLPRNRCRWVWRWRCWSSAVPPCYCCTDGRGTDAVYGGEVARVGEFVPTGAGESEFRVVDNVRPGHVGTVADERVDPIDVTATVVDLAVRGHLLITELPRPSEYARTDWTLTRTGDGTGLRPFEQALLDGLAPAGGVVRISELANRVHESIAHVQDELYDEVVTNGWYERRPDATRNRFTQLALGGLALAVVVTVLLAAFSTFGLVGLALIVLALGLVFVAQEMPSRTARGVALLKGLGALRSELMSHPTDQMPAGQQVTELSEVLPYAIVLGGSERWLEALVATDTDLDPDSDDLSWYHGPDDWHLRDLPDSLQNFLTTVSGTLFTR